LLRQGGLLQSQETWAIWALGRIAPSDRTIDAWLAGTGATLSPNARLQAIRIAAHRIRQQQRAERLPAFVVTALRDPEPRVRFAAVQAVAQARQRHLVPQISTVLTQEQDRAVYYAAWHALREVAAPDELLTLLKDDRGAVRRGALLALLESRALEPVAVKPLVQDRDPGTSEIAATWLALADGNPLIDVSPRPGDFVESVTVRITPGIKPGNVRFTLDGSEPTSASRSGSPGRLTDTTTLKAALFVGTQKIGNTMAGTYRKRESTFTSPPGKVETPTTVEQVLPLLAAADSTRGAGLFKSAGCASCHRAGDEGRAIGPDLSAIGDRDDADSIVRSILNPNQIIVEGYGLLTVSTRDGKGLAGIFESETDRTLRIVQLDGESVAVEKSAIASRRNIHQSPMPPYDGALNPRDVADLVTWLTRPSTATGGVTQSAQSAPASPGFAWQLQPGRLSILYAGRPLMEYVFVDPEILRPYFQNVHAPSGAQLTRTNPPAAGDAADHATMHPGVWLAFGDVNGEDFWRNKGRIEHVAFVTEPSLVEGRLVFATRSRLVAGNAATVATLISRFAIAPSGDHAFMLTWEAEIRGDGRDLVFGDQEEMGLGVRVATELTELKGGLVVNSSGVKGAKTVWGNQADWAAYSREVGGRTQGVAIFPSPSNTNPTWWHSRDYGVIVANGFGKRALPASPDGKLVVKAGDALKLRYDVLLFDTPATAPIDLASAYRRLQSELKPAR
jgi:putative heme-binding domain-containing protein